ncbi:MAG: ATP-binding protein [Anaerolineae bacterium]
MIGHEWAVYLMRGRLATGRFGHAYLITGTPGIGRATLAIRAAQALNCLDTTSPDPCFSCRACVMIERGIHPDITTIAAEGRTIKTETIREMQHDLALQPLEGRYKIVLIEDFQKATDNAADALLKTLEEPPSRARLLLTADAARNVRPTIVSRSQVITLRPVPSRVIEEALVERDYASPQEAPLLAHLAAGRPGWAISAATDPTVLENRIAVQQQIIDVLRANRVYRFSYAESIYRSEGLGEMLDIWQAWWRDIMLRVEGADVAPVNADRTDDIDRLGAMLGVEEVRKALRAVRATIHLLNHTNANKRLALEVMLLQMPYIR